ncbi:MAG: TolC family protein [Chlorobiaceae bacterium]|nr:TolC family protein [Chlorobiaceae bacterium]NTW10208.1 TolC family protein [Chlorobiaceae bacterium]
MRFRALSYLCIVSLLCFNPAKARGAVVEEKKLNLSDCISIALNNANAAKKAQYSLKLQAAEVLRRYGSFLPKLSVSGTYTPYALSRSYTQYNYTDFTRIRTESESLQFAVTTSLNIFNGFRDYAALQSAIEKQRAAGYSLSRALETVAFDVTQAYYQVLLDKELLDIARENLISAKDQLTLTDRQYQIGLKSLIDLQQQQAEAASAGLTLIKAENHLQRSTLELLRRLQIEPRTKITLVPSPGELKIPSRQKLDIDSLCTLASSKRADLKSMEGETAASKWLVTESKGALLPRIDLNFTVSTGGTAFYSQSIGDGPVTDYALPPLSDQLGNTIGYNVALNLSWPLFDGFQTRYAVESAKIGHMTRQLDFEELKNNIVIDIQQVAGDYSSAFSEIETAKVSLIAADSAYKGMKRKYELGAAGFVELSAARAAFFNARSSLSQATYNLALQKTVLDFTTGTIPIEQP